MTDAIYTGWKAIAKRLGIGERTAQRWGHKGALPVVRKGRTIIMRESNLQVWLDAHADRLSKAWDSH